MRNKQWSVHLLAVFCNLLFTAAAVGCLVTGWNLQVASPGRLVFWGALLSVLIPLFLYVPHGVWAMPVLAVPGAIALFKDGVFGDQISSLLHSMTSHYQRVYNWPVFGESITDETDFVLIMVICLTVLSVSGCICCRMHLWVSMPCVLLPLVLCLLTTDTLPAVWALYLMLTGIAMLLVTDWVRMKSPGQFVSLTLRTILPAAAAMALLFVLNPEEKYVNHAAQLQKEAVVLAEKVQSAAESVVTGSFTDSLGSERLSLRSVGPKNELTYPVMRITAPYDGTVYLRGRDYDIYTGTAWEASEERIETLPAATDSIGTFTVTTYTVRDMLYISYGAVQDIQLIGGQAENTGNLKSYSYPVGRTLWGDTQEYEYLDLPADTTEWAEPLAWNILDGIPAGTSTQEKARRIGRYVKDSASYALSTASMDGDHDDFAEWFLTESDTGYCVHFATAAAVLLRAAGISARYVEGYAVTCQADANTLVTNQSAHAWVEYYDAENKRWNVLEATPGEAVLAGEVIPDEEETTETAPSETEPETETEPVGETADAPGTSDNPADPSDTDNGGTIGEGRGTFGGVEENPGASAGEVPAKTPFRLPAWVKTLGWSLLAMTLIPLTGELRLAGKRKQWNTGKPNEMALTRWKQAKRLARLTKTELPAALDELAMKAAYSQYTLTPEELERFDRFREEIRQTIGKMPWYRKYFLRWILSVG